VNVYDVQSARVIKGIPKRKRRKNEIKKKFFLILLILSILSIVENGQVLIEKIKKPEADFGLDGLLALFLE
jgi:hypothetical protein